MSLDKAIEHGKEHRKRYYKSKAIDRTCRCHETCEVCKENGGFSMNFYVKKPVVISAVQWGGINVRELQDFVDNATLSLKPEVGIHTLEGFMKISIGDFVIKGVNGEFYPCKPDIFEKTYEHVVSYVVSESDK